MRVNIRAPRPLRPAMRLSAPHGSNGRERVGEGVGYAIIPLKGDPIW